MWMHSGRDIQTSKLIRSLKVQNEREGELEGLCESREVHGILRTAEFQQLQMMSIDG